LNSTTLDNLDIASEMATRQTRCVHGFRRIERNRTTGCRNTAPPAGALIDASKLFFHHHITTDSRTFPFDFTASVKDSSLIHLHWHSAA